MTTLDIRGASLSLADPPITTNPNADLAWKAPVRVATTGSNINLQTIGLGTIDGIALAAGDRVLVKDQTDATTNGLYNVATGPWTRTIDANNNSQWSQGLQVFVTQGTLNGNFAFILTTANPIALGTSTLSFTVDPTFGNMPPKTFKANATGSTASPTNITGDTAESLLLFTQTGSGATQRSLDSKIKDYAVSVFDFGAKGDGTTDDTTAIQNAINSLPVTGGDVIFPPGNYKVTGTINLGNGSASSVSTLYGMRLVGVGMPVEPVGFAGYPTASCARIFWAGSAGGTVMKVLGPLQGWAVQNLLLDGMSSANRGLDVVSGQYGDVKNLVILGCMTWGLYSETVAPFGGVTFTGAHHNRYDNVTVQVPVAAVGGGIILTSNGASTSNTLFNVFTNTTVAIFGSTQNGIYFQAAAGNVFFGVHISGSVGDVTFVFDYTVNSAWPANNAIIGAEPIVSSTLAQNIGAPGALARPNYLYNLITTDGSNYTALANLVTDAGQLFGTQTSDDAITGNVGEYVSSTVLIGSAMPLTTNTPANVTSINLTKGDWDVWFQGDFSPAGSTNITILQSSISTTSATMNNNPPNLGAFAMPAGVPAANPISILAGPVRMSLAITTTVFGVAVGVFTVAALGAYGILRARRVR